VHVQLWHNVITHLANQGSDILPPGKSVWFRTVKGHKLSAYFAAWTWDARSCVLRIAHCKTCGTGISSDSISSSLMLNMSVSRTIQNIPVHLLTSHNWLVVYLPLWRIWKSMGRMTSHILWLMLMMVNKKLTLINGGVKRWENHLFLWAMASMAIWQCVKTLYPWWTSK